MTDVNLSAPAVRKPYRGYVASRPVRGSAFPQQVQNLVIRDYARRMGLLYLLSATEYAMPSCFLMLEAVLDELPKLGGIIMFSIFMLPKRKARRIEMYERILGMRSELHASLENVVLHCADDIGDLEDLLDVSQVLTNLPLGGRYEKDETSREERGRDTFWSALSANL